MARKFQVVVWWRPWSEWWIGRWRWPKPRDRALMRRHTGRDDFGFHGWQFGPLEIRYWPNMKGIEK